MITIPVIKQNLSDNIKQILKEYISSMAPAKSMKLPPEVELGKMFGVSRVTIRRALDDLEQEGLIFRVHGRGTFVNPEALRIKVSLIPAQELSHLIRQGGFQTRIELVDVRRTNDEKIAERLGIDGKDALVRIEKVYYADEHPAIICVDYVPELLLGIEFEKAEWDKLSTFDVLRRYAGCILTRDMIELQALTLKEVRKMIGHEPEMGTNAVLEMDVLGYDQNNQRILLGQVFYDTNYVRFSLMRGQTL